ncbi:MAG: DNA translocase FtsK [Lachnospiraceae bacterium]|nr:DNA translocase FtsK [Lachnospiraceae bacterium]
MAGRANTSRSNSNNRKKSTSAGSRRSTTSGNKRTTASSKKNNNVDYEPMINTELAIILSVAAGLLLFLCNFGLIGVVGNVIGGFLFGVFGWPWYIGPIFFTFIIVFGIVNRDNIVARIRIFCSVLIFLVFSIFAELISGVTQGMSTYSIGYLYNSCSEDRMGGGVIAGSIAYAGCKYIGKAGIILISILILLICILVITGRSLLDTLRSGRDFAQNKYEDARMGVREYRESYEEYIESRNAERDEEVEEQPRRKKKVRGNFDPTLNPVSDSYEEKKDKKRVNKKASGVALETTVDDGKARKHRDDMHEIILTDVGDVHKEEQKIISNEQMEDMVKIRIHTDSEDMNARPQSVSYDNVPAKESVEYTTDEYGQIRFNTEGAEQQTQIRSNTEDAEQQTQIRFNTEGAEQQTDVYNTQNIGLSKEARSVKPVKKVHKYIAPDVKLLNKTKTNNNSVSKGELVETANVLQNTLETFGVKAKVTDISMGPSVTRFELQPELGVRVNKITQLSDDIKLALAATDVRIEAPIPGKSAVGIEVPNKESSAVGFRELVESKEFINFESKLCFGVGKDISGNVVVADIAKMPHMLIAGATGSGKSVCINTIIMSILYKASPDEVKLIMIDPKVVELSVYNGIPHLMVPVVTEPKKAAAALNWGVAEMMDRYKKFETAKVRDLKGYNKIAVEKLPQIVIIVDELADLMMVAAKEVEESICRIAQLARACGIHLVIATQRPSVDVITGLIKANMPSRVAFAVSSAIDSRTILDTGGAEKLLGRGDMLFYPQGYSKPARIQGAFISDAEVSNVVDFLKSQDLGDLGSEEIEKALNAINSAGSGSSTGGSSSGDSEYDDLIRLAGRFIIESEKASIGALQRKFKIGFNRAARIMDQLCELGVVSEEQGTKPRLIQMSMDEFDELAI